MDQKGVKKATALAYTPGEDRAPRVIASGKGVIAEKILEKARGEKIPVVEDSHLAQALEKLQLGSEIPPELYEVVAQVLSFISRVDQAAGEKFQNLA